MGGRVLWIHRSGYLITSLLLPSSTPWTGGTSTVYQTLHEVAEEQGDCSLHTCLHTQSPTVKSELLNIESTLIAHLQLLQGSGGHVGILEVDEGTETLMKNSDALYLTKPVTTQNTELSTFSNTVWH